MYRQFRVIRFGIGKRVEQGERARETPRGSKDLTIICRILNPMARLSSVPIRLTIPEHRELRRIREFHPKKRYWMRADIVLRADAGQSNLVIAHKLEISRNTVKHWRYRFAREGMSGLKDRPIPGRPRKAVGAPQALEQTIPPPVPQPVTAHV